LAGSRDETTDSVSGGAGGPAGPGGSSDGLSPSLKPARFPGNTRSGFTFASELPGSSEPVLAGHEVGIPLDHRQPLIPEPALNVHNTPSYQNTFGLAVGPSTIGYSESAGQRTSPAPGMVRLTPPTSSDATGSTVDESRMASSAGSAGSMLASPGAMRQTQPPA